MEVHFLSDSGFTVLLLTLMLYVQISLCPRIREFSTLLDKFERLNYSANQKPVNTLI